MSQLNNFSILDSVYNDFTLNYLSSSSLPLPKIESQLLSSLSSNGIEMVGPIPYYTLFNIQQARQEILDLDEDCIIGVFGFAGKGKTTVSFINNFSLDSKFDHNRIIFTFEELLDFLKLAATELKKEKSNSSYRSYLRGYNIVIDEGVYIFFSSDVNTKQGKLATKLLTVIRFLNLVVFINATNYERLNKLLRESRLRLSIRIREKGIIEFRGPKQTLAISVDENNSVLWSEPNFVEECGFISKNNKFWQNYTFRKGDFTYNVIMDILTEVSK